MRFLGNTKKILTKSYVAWLVYIGSAVQVVFEFGLSSALPTWVVMLFLALILLSRTVKQKEVSGPGKAGEAVAGETPREFVGEHGDGSAQGEGI